MNFNRQSLIRTCHRSHDLRARWRLISPNVLWICGSWGARTQHGAAATTGAGSASAAGASIGGLVGAVGGSLPPDGHSRATRGLGRRGTRGGGTGRGRRVDGGAGARGRLGGMEG